MTEHRRPSDPATLYAERVVAGELVTGRAVRRACQRHLDDLDRQNTPAFPYVYVSELAESVVDFFPAFLTLDDGQPFVLPDWLQFCFGCLEGWMTAEGHRRFRTGYIETGKGSGKTPAGGGYGLCKLVDERSPTGAEIYSLGVDHNQAKYLFQFGKKMAERPGGSLNDLLDVGENNIALLSRYSYFRPLSAEGRSLDNKKPFLSLIDEVHEHPNSTIVEKMRLGFKGNKDGLMLLLTNAGHDKLSICGELHDYAIKVLEGQEDPTLFAYVCQLDVCEKCRAGGATQPQDGCPDCDDWTDEAVWPKANPSLGITIDYDYLRGVVREALNRPSMQARVKRLNFCIWTQTFNVWIPHDRVVACSAELADGNRGRACAFGWDLSTKLDLTGGVAAVKFDDEEGEKADEVELTTEAGKVKFTLDFSVEITPWFWIPKDTMYERIQNESIPYDVWEGLGYITTTPGPVVDYNLIYDTFYTKIQPKFNPQRVGYDPYNATQFALQLRDGPTRCTIAEVAQGKKLSEIYKLMEALILTRRLRHNGNACYIWCYSNALVKSDRFQNITVEKSTGGKRIDGVTATATALSQLLTIKQSVYAKRGVLLV